MVECFFVQIEIRLLHQGTSMQLWEPVTMKRERDNMREIGMAQLGEAFTIK